MAVRRVGDGAAIDWGYERCMVKIHNEDTVGRINEGVEKGLDRKAPCVVVDGTW